jgi:hypothetical protein
VIEMERIVRKVISFTDSCEKGIGWVTAEQKANEWLKGFVQNGDTKINKITPIAFNDEENLPYTKIFIDYQEEETI